MSRRSWRLCLVLAGSLLFVPKLASAEEPAPAWPEALNSPFAAHNAYPWRLYGDQRLNRALAAGIKHIELDITYDPTRQTVVVTHDSRPQGQEPELATLVETAFARWEQTGLSGFTLILDFKSSGPQIAQGVSKILAPYASRLSSLPKAGGELRPGKITVCLTGTTEAHRQYADTVGEGESYLAFGDVGHGDWREIAAEYVPSEPAGFVRFVTLPRNCFQETATAKGDAHVSEGRMREVVRTCNLRGYRLRIYSYNPVRTSGQEDTSPWEKCVAAGVHMISTDNYEAAQTWWAAHRPKAPIGGE